MTVDNVPAPVARRSRRRRIALGVGLTLALGVGLFVAFGRGRAPALPKLPDPNGYDDLVAAGQMIQGKWPNKGDLVRADPVAVRAFVTASKGAIDRARVGLSRECMVPFENSLDGQVKHFDDLGRVRSAAGLFLGEAIVAEADGDIGAAVRACLDQYTTGQRITQGGMAVDASIGWVVQNQAIERLRKLRDKLSSAQCRSILQSLEATERIRVSLDDLDRRWQAWYQGAYNPLQRTMMRTIGVEAKGRKDEGTLAKTSRDRIERATRFFLVEIAIHAYHLDKGTWPRKVEELVPGYLAEAPVDSTTGKVVDYPTDASGEMTDDLSSIARPDGTIARPDGTVGPKP